MFADAYWIQKTKTEPLSTSSLLRLLLRECLLIWEAAIYARKVEIVIYVRSEDVYRLI